MKGKGLLIIALLVSSALFAGTVDSFLVYSASMKKNIPCVVIKPSSYKSLVRKKKGLPVVFLLHGYSGNQGSWLKDAPQLIRKADELELILVCPDGGFSSWYFDSPIDSSIRYETFISKELVPFIDKKYSTLADRKHRAITGLSMGGHGGLYLGIRHQDIFGSAGSVSGGVYLRPFPNNWDIKKRIGDTVCCVENWENYSVINQVDKLKTDSLHLVFDCGTSDFFLDVNRNLHQVLLQKKIAHDYAERPGAHNKDYWGNSIDYQLLYFKKQFDR